ncbi:DUF1661 domain-containing protein [Porphyromonas gulae]|uniref:DUF1661 domain-containing protein n=1 Tax=Porphyromonas gulae TaxID=111105 RepID=UPI0037422E11
MSVVTDGRYTAFLYVVREKTGIWLPKTWREKNFVLEREVKIFGTKAKNLSRVFSPKHAPQSDRFRLVICRQQETLFIGSSSPL